MISEIDQSGGCCRSFVIETSQKFWNMKNFPLPKNCWNWHGGQFWVEENNSGLNTYFLKLNPLTGGKYPNLMTCSLFRPKFSDVISSKIEKLLDSNFTSDIILHESLLLMQSFVSIDWCQPWFLHPGLWGPPSRGLACDWKGSAC